jgi:hypothetical protein
MFPKTQRTENPGLLEQVRAQRCAACGTSKQVEAHHVTTRKTGGDDTEDNVMPLCHFHHMEWHQIGPVRLAKKNPGVARWLVAHKRIDVIERAAARIGGEV